MKEARVFLEQLKNYYLFLAVTLMSSRFVKLGVFVFLALVLTSDSVHAYDGTKYKEICSKTLDMLHGGFGALLMASAGVGAIVASATGGFRLAWALVVVALGAFTLKEYQEIWFEPC